MTENIDIIPFAYRTHTHKLGVVNSAYIIKTNSQEEQLWIEIGRRSPQLAQMFYPVTNENITITKGDIFVSRCYMENFKNRIVNTGPTGEDEMVLNI
jgi:peptidylglycine monooxygenase